MKYTLYIGLNDCFYKKQLISTKKAVAIIEDALLQYVGGGTIYNARGIYTHENGEKVCENTIVCEVFGGEDTTDLYLMLDFLKYKLNQESIIIEAAKVNSIFY